MGVFVNKLKLTAAASSMYQFCPELRKVLPRGCDDEAVEAATVFLYERLAQEVLGRRFAASLAGQLREQARFGTPAELDVRIARIGQALQDFERLAEALAPTTRSSASDFTSHVTNVIRALLAEAGAPHDEPELVRDTFPRFQEAARRIKKHLLGIKSQSHFVMK